MPATFPARLLLALIAVVLIGSTALIVSRLDDLRSEKQIDSLISREAVFLVNNLLLVALTAVIRLRILEKRSEELRRYL